MILTFVAALAVTVAQATTPPPQTGKPQTGKPPATGTATQKPGTPAKPSPASEALRTQVMLDRAGFSPGVIDGRNGPSTRKAAAAYQKHAGGATPAEAIEPLTRYAITQEDTAGPFVERIPADLVEQSKLPNLGYTSVVEALAERFHTTPAFLQKLNPGAKFAAGEEIQVPNVVPMLLPAKTSDLRAARGAQSQDQAVQDVIVTVTKSDSALRVTDAASGRVLLYAPVTTGSTRDPLPIGEWKVNGVSINPPFNYNPKLFWDADPTHSKAKIPPGPNNPVGVVWVDLSKEHYGIHGTPEPSTIGRTQSHGCVRLTNWDALNVATLVRPGTKVVFAE